MPLATMRTFGNNFASRSILSPARSCDFEKIAGSPEPAAPARYFPAGGLGVVCRGLDELLILTNVGKQTI
jgi:hypothetical protein